MKVEDILEALKAKKLILIGHVQEIEEQLKAINAALAQEKKALEKLEKKEE